MQRLGWVTRPHAVHDLQAAAAVGQMGLAQAYETRFSGLGLKTAQILLTHDDLADRTRYLNARTTLTTLLEAGRSADHQRKRHRRHRRNQVRRQRHAGRIGRQSGRGRGADDPHRPAGALQRRPAQGSNSAADRPRGTPTTTFRSHGRWRRQRHQPGWHDHQGPSRTPCCAQRCTYAHCQWPRARRAAAPDGRRASRHPAPSPMPHRWRRASSGWPITCNWPAV
jgi:hypothetical protein